jgi:hypothetical protein
MPKRKKKSVAKVNNNITTMSDNTIGDLMQPAQYVALDFVAKSDYNKLYKENGELRAKLLKSGADCTSLKIHIELLELKNSNLEKAIDMLKAENKLLGETIESQNKKIDVLSETVNKQNEQLCLLMKEKKEHHDMMATAEICMLYERTLVRYVIGKDTYMTYPELIECNKLDGNQQSRLCEIEKELKLYNSDLHDMNQYMKGFKYDRNRMSHPISKMKDLSIIDLRETLNACVDASKDDIEKQDYKDVGNFMLGQLENKFGLGEKPFNNEYVAKRKGFGHRN